LAAVGAKPPKTGQGQAIPVAHKEVRDLAVAGLAPEPLEQLHSGKLPSRSDVMIPRHRAAMRLALWLLRASRSGSLTLVKLTRLKTRPFVLAAVR
jgi:hypothetical protein